MKKKAKKKYEKPKVTIINLDARVSVLGFCKTNGFSGPGEPFNCNAPVYCTQPGS